MSKNKSYQDRNHQEYKGYKLSPLSRRGSPTILTLNVGSSSVKYAVFSGTRMLLSGLIEKILTKPVHYNGGIGEPVSSVSSLIHPASYTGSFQYILHRLNQNNIQVDAVAHRVVHGEYIKQSTRITPALIRVIQRATELAPLHNKPELEGIRIALPLFKVPHVAVFDTSFHQAMPAKAYTYAIPRWLASKYRIRRYGFHGISHSYVFHEACRVLHKKPRTVKMITCHLGNGCSVAAIEGGKSVDTSMGYPPLEGLVMGTRAGDLDPAIPVIMMKHHASSPSKVDGILNKESGLKGLSGISNDIRDIQSSSSPRAKLALDVFCYRLIKYLGAYAAALNGVDVIVFTAGIGENSAYVRERVVSSLSYLGVVLDSKKNKENKLIISSPKSKVVVCVIPTNESLMMAKETIKVLGMR